MTARAYSVVYRGPRDRRGGFLLDVDLGFYRWRTAVPVRARTIRSRRLAGELPPGTRTTAVIEPATPGLWVADLEPELTPQYRYPARVVHVTDGDTVLADIDVGLGDEQWRNRPVRLSGCNLIELKDPGGRESRDNTAAEITGKAPDGRVTLHTVKPDKYADRIDARVELPGGVDLTRLLIASNWAVPWNGRGPKPVPAWPRPAPF